MKPEIIFASQNKGKTSEIATLIGDRFQLLNLADKGIVQELDEPFDTLQENALCKAKQVFQMTGIPSFADDTGLEIDALNGKPGVYSARYAGEEKDPQKNMDKILAELHGSPNRKARFRTVIAFVDGQQEKIFEGEVIGTITLEKHGKKGFGYDPVFRPDGSEKTFGQMEMEEKNKFSHRARAMEKFIAFLNTNS
ncbi:MAG TPA: RdgB/HAM1 family non-canonical purine NTP pyrophosphatase [Bacteroidia bacterium]|jgi:XTP/dITP diphosphohydrolase|nr:RdgB/HAM1 family non-canonical purine NTP pyrophosphatase [Bacteroidia bacterium]